MSIGSTRMSPARHSVAAATVSPSGRFEGPCGFIGFRVCDRGHNQHRPPRSTHPLIRTCLRSGRSWDVPKGSTHPSAQPARSECGTSTRGTPPPTRSPRARPAQGRWRGPLRAPRRLLFSTSCRRHLLRYVGRDPVMPPLRIVPRSAAERCAGCACRASPPLRKRRPRRRLGRAVYVAAKRSGSSARP